MVNKKVAKTVISKFQLDGKDLEVFNRLIELNYINSPEADIEFDRLLDSLYPDSTDIINALMEYQLLSTKRKKSDVLVEMLKSHVKDIFARVRKQSDKKVLEIVKEAIRGSFIVVITGTDYGNKLYYRTVHSEVGGLSGHVSDIDREYAKKHNLNDLNRLERWLMHDFIKIEKKRRKEAFRQSCIEVLGEDPETDW